jgi:hypothetical protein
MTKQNALRVRLHPRDLRFEYQAQAESALGKCLETTAFARGGRWLGCAGLPYAQHDHLIAILDAFEP